MPCQLERVFGFLAPRHNNEPPKINEVWEHDGVLLVRLGRGSAMQVRIQPDRSGVLFRIVPIAKATLVKGDVPWQVASESQLLAWMHPDSAIGQWLERQLDESDLPMMSLP